MPKAKKVVTKKTKKSVVKETLKEKSYDQLKWECESLRDVIRMGKQQSETIRKGFRGLLDSLKQRFQPVRLHTTEHIVGKGIVTQYKLTRYWKENTITLGIQLVTGPVWDRRRVIVFHTLPVADTLEEMVSALKLGERGDWNWDLCELGSVHRSHIENLIKNFIDKNMSVDERPIQNKSNRVTVNFHSMKKTYTVKRNSTSMKFLKFALGLPEEL